MGHGGGARGLSPSRESPQWMQSAVRDMSPQGARETPPWLQRSSPRGFASEIVESGPTTDMIAVASAPGQPTVDATFAAAGASPRRIGASLGGALPRLGDGERGALDLEASPRRDPMIGCLAAVCNGLEKQAAL